EYFDIPTAEGMDKAMDQQDERKVGWDTPENVDELLEGIYEYQLNRSIISNGRKSNTSTDIANFLSLLQIFFFLGLGCLAVGFEAAGREVEWKSKCSGDHGP
ncbi:unnamed protein product, partial [Ilex paraguariensis]